MTQRDSKYVSSPKAVNRRTSVRQLLPAQPVNPAVRERLLATQARSRLGAPLAEQLGTADAAAARTAPSPMLVLGSVAAAASAVALLLAGFQFSWMLLALGVLGLAAGLALILVGRRAAGRARAGVLPATVLFDEAALRAFDQVLKGLAPEVPDAVAVELSNIKQVLVRIGRLAAGAAIDENFTMDDRMYLSECVRRYMPDSLQSFLAVPRDQRATPVLENGQSAVSLLLGQLGLLRAELEQRELKLTRSVAEQLLQQQRFLESKAKR